MNRRRSNTSWSSPRGEAASPSILASADSGRSDNTGPARRPRAPTACLVCRARKVKCSNGKPSCAGCARLGCECVYPEPPKYALQSTPSSSSQSNSEVLDALNEILRRLPPVTESRPEVQVAGPASTSPHAFTAMGHVFEWPIFAMNKSSHGVAFGVLGTSQMQEISCGASPAFGMPRLDGEEISALLTRFLRMVHIMNPILDCTTLMNYGRTIAELGPQWDSQTCLVLVAVALGAIADPFSSFADTVETLSSSSSRQDGAQSRQRAESYYQSARRRFGLLGISLTACHCHLLSGIYLLYTLRPIEAWNAFFQASSLYTVYLKSQAAVRITNEPDSVDMDMLPDEHDCHDELRECLEQRLYWSCIKSESEVCAEVELPKSALHTMDYPYQFPSPPTPKSVDGLDDSQYHGTSASSATTILSSCPPPTEIQDFKELHESSWFNYLSEISLSRLSNSVDQAFYMTPSASWTSMNLLDMITMACSFEEQIERWQETLPQPIASCFDKSLDLSTVSELQLAPWLRSANIKLRIYRPFLYCLAHRRDKCWPVDDAVRQLAQKAVLLCLDPLFNFGLRHRDAGMWFRCRETACRALILICAGKVGLLQKMDLERHAQETLKVCLAHLRYWETEADDVRLARQALEKAIS
ncbi:Zn(2)-C6 fungal-type domain-containing protein [Trichoderma simmonsii]|uniref:Zn(2)-C6 fungal-type domain-containing protein n=1 Tax=Trichoderma simmonsii TaxID=1491479 RepID=A0A8G0LI87_9HYPO|nr:Zn(2)-C6 fungal-type domain-containing protein [Trichoderma simmonsii]